MPTYTRDQVCAQYASSFVDSKLRGLGPKDFAKACKNASSRIMIAGLGGALAFAIAKAGKKKSTEELKYDHVALALAGFLGEGEDQKRTPLKYLQALIKKDAVALRADTDKAMMLLQWLARLSDGKAILIGDEGSGDE